LPFKTEKLLGYGITGTKYKNESFEENGNSSV
jgi:hypothetical protein